MTNRFSFRRQGVWLVSLAILIAAVGAWFVFDPGFHSHGNMPAASADPPEAEFENRVAAYLLNHPEVIIEAVNRYQSRQVAQQETEAQLMLKARSEEIFRDKGSPVAGNPIGDVTLVEFFDYNCPYCRKMTPIIEQLISDDAQLRIVYKEFPILGSNSILAAKAALAAQEQGKYAPFHDGLFQLPGATEPSKVMEVASKVGLNIERLKSDMEKPAIQTAIEKNLALAQALQINGTPGFVIGNQILRGATDLKTLQDLIRAARENPQ